MSATVSAILMMTGSVVELRGRLAVASFPNNIDNIDPTNYTWVKNFSNVTRRQYLLLRLSLGKHSSGSLGT
jgi:hypothetical protein